MANAYILVYIREDHVEDMLKPPKPTAALRERIEREQEEKQKARYNEQTKVVLSLSSLLIKIFCMFCHFLVVELFHEILLEIASSILSALEAMIMSTFYSVDAAHLF